MPTAKRTALVTGASGLAGGYMVAHLLEQGGCGVLAEHWMFCRMKRPKRNREAACRCSGALFPE
jgi:nucleoside-diphosphate-sugar epimerase